ncbi:hypothetical protein Q4F19_06325 [Sphingomonas sp. BIUV-7]|uniref:Uncharacterized protein n=1 Tax=Sphingomonas natans TaxID=3063330 RepID=A0ABT8Y6P3_9SPHN|nr:hypothetical protein [Sphingomonas sp. BIUV-7]MDO6413992.1 hypothetical protein [Sphingomonas sp. BIUV-7]
MIAMQVARIIANFVVFFELADDDIVDPDTAVKMMEDLGSGLDTLDKGFLRELVDAFAVIAEENSGEVQEVIRNIPYSFYLEEELAADDPVRLAELDAIREAKD